MTSSQSWRSAYRDGLSSSAERKTPAAGRPRGAIHLALSRGRSLGEGMAIAAAIEARLLGIRLLSLRATVDVLPAEAEAATAEPARPLLSRRRMPAGRALLDASQAIDTGAAELRSARELMP